MGAVKANEQNVASRSSKPHPVQQDRIRRRTEEILYARGVEKPEQIGPKLALPTFEVASEEIRFERQLRSILLTRSRAPMTDQEQGQLQSKLMLGPSALIAVCIVRWEALSRSVLSGDLMAVWN